MDNERTRPGHWLEPVLRVCLSALKWLDKWQEDASPQNVSFIPQCSLL